MEESDIEEEEEEFLQKIAKIDAKYFLFNRETAKLYDGPSHTMIDHVCPAAFRETYHPLKGRDLGVDGILKHYSYSDIADFLNVNISKCKTFQHMNGKLYSVVLDYQGKETQVTIKNWEFSFGSNSRYGLYPAMLYNDITITRPDRKRRPNVPKVIGYSIDKILAVVYDLHPLCSLTEAMFGSPELTSQFGWQRRLKAAIGVGLAIESFHADDIVVGCIDSDSMLLDQEFNVHLCVFGLQIHAEKMVSVELKKLLPLRCEGYGSATPECCLVEIPPNVTVDRPTLKVDIFAYGLLLLELISKQKHGYPCYQQFAGMLPVSPDKLSNFVHESFLEVEESEAKEITSLAQSCVSKYPGDRPEIRHVVDILMSLEKRIVGHRDKIIKI